MLRFLSAVPALSLAPVRALSDGTSGSIGRNAVGAYEIRDGDVPFAKLSNAPGGSVLGRTLPDGTGAPRALSEAELRTLVENSSSNLFAATRAEAESFTPSANLQTIVLLGQFDPGDGGGGVYIRRGASMPSHDARFQTADGQWWENIEFEPTPLAFGARWDGVTDDTDAINAWAIFLRASRKAGRLPPGQTKCLGTLYLGGVSIRGAGGPSNDQTFSSRTVIRSSANPMISMAPGEAAERTLFYTNWEDFIVVGDTSATIQPIELWDRLSYPYQIGLWLGRNHRFMQTVSNGEQTASGGAGGMTMRGVAVQDASGWGIYGYKLWGKSLIDDVFLRRCGGRAAFELNDDRLGGGINLAGICVDFTFSNIHSFNSGYPNVNWSERGTGLRIGARETDTDALDRIWESGGNQKFESVFLERHHIGLDISGTFSTMIEHFSMSGEKIHLGHAANRSNNLKVTFGKWRTFGLQTIDITQSALVDLGQYLNQDLQSTTEIRYATGFSWSPPGRGADVGRFYASPTVLTPVDESAPGTRSLSGFIPFADVDFDQGDPLSNRLPSFGPQLGALSGWVHDGTGVIRIDQPWLLRLREGAEVHYEATGLTPGTLCTLQWWFELPGALLLQDVEFASQASDGSFMVRRALGSGDRVDTLEWRAMNAVVPADGALRIWAKNSSSNNAFLRTPLLTLGACRPMGRHPLSLWPAADGLHTTL